jgi:hypothetical protein
MAHIRSRVSSMLSNHACSVSTCTPLQHTVSKHEHAYSVVYTMLQVSYCMQLATVSVRTCVLECHVRGALSSVVYVLTIYCRTVAAATSLQL